MKKSNYQKYFKNKNITVMGIGILGRNIGDIKFMAENGANITATDLKSENELKKSLRRLKKFKNIKYTLGRHLMSDFKNKDFILKGNGINLENKYIKTAENNNIPIYMSLAMTLDILRRENKNVIVVGITGTKGKSTTTAMLESILKESDKIFHLAGNIRGIANLPILKKINNGDIILAELDSWQLQGFHDIKISPNISVFTNFFEDHLNYYNGSMKKYFYDKSAIFRYQKKSDLLIMTNESKASIDKFYQKEIASKKIIARFSKNLQSQHYMVFGRHNEKNIALSYQVGVSLKIPEKIIFSALTKFRAINGRFQYIDTQNKIHFYNDNNSTTPESTIISLQSLKKEYPDRNIILIAGGFDKNFNYEKLSRYIEREIYFSILFSGTATDKIKSYFKKDFGRVVETMRMETAVNIAIKKADDGDIIILSPGAASFGLFSNEYDRNDQYLRFIKKAFKKK